MYCPAAVAAATATTRDIYDFYGQHTYTIHIVAIIWQHRAPREKGCNAIVRYRHTHDTRRQHDCSSVDQTINTSLQIVYGLLTVAALRFGF